jgi:hypothetical protein
VIAMAAIWPIAKFPKRLEKTADAKTAFGEHY